MRVITGTAKGRRLETLAGNDVRPTTANVKEAVFSIIQFSVEDSVFLDAFAGSGQMGIEALSRGARTAYFIDKSRKSMETVKRNLDAAGLSDRAVTKNTDTLGFLSETSERFDIAFLDPPYRTGLLEKAPLKTADVMNKSGYIICEHPVDEKIPDEVGNFAAKKNYRYGKIAVTVYSHKGVE